VSERESWGVREWQAEGTVDVHSEGGSWGVGEPEGSEARAREILRMEYARAEELGSWGVEVGILKRGRAQHGERRG
jgi:hypothetical protein